MAQVTIKMRSGEEIVANHQFGTVRRSLNMAALRTPDDKTNSVAAFAEFNTDDGRRGVNPADVSSYAEIKNSNVPAGVGAGEDED